MTGLRGRLVAAALVAAVVIGLAPAIRVQAAPPEPTRAAELTAGVDGVQTFSLPFAASHVALHWPGQPNARLSAAFSADGVTFGEPQEILLDEVGEHRGNGESYGSVMVAHGATAVRVTSDRPLPRVSVLVLDSDASADADPAAWGLGGSATAALAQPPIISRAGWGADESLRLDDNGDPIWPSRFWPIQKLGVHHTVTQNNDPNPRATVRSIYYYHAVTQGWGDIGYNFLVDEAGNIYEGRYSRRYASGEVPTGEDTRGYGVEGGHALGYNAGTMGVALLGTLTDRDATPAARQALERLLAWKAERHGIDPLGSSTYVNPVSGARTVMPNLFGHRDVNSTACPGGSFYATMPALRSATAARIPPADTAPPRVIYMSPAANATGVATGANVAVTFSEPVSGVTTNTFRLRDTVTGALVPASVTYNASTRSALLNPASPLVAGRRYKAGVGGSIRDGAGNAMSSWVIWYFTTAYADTTPPRVTYYGPSSGATNVSVWTHVQANFSEPVSGVTTNTFRLRDTVTGRLVAASVSYNPSTRVAVLVPSSPLVHGRRYKAGVGGSIRDAAGNAMSSWLIWYFRTAP